jgi:putative hemolysin
MSRFSTRAYLPKQLAWINTPLSFLLDLALGLTRLAEVYNRSRGKSPRDFTSEVLKSVQVTFKPGDDSIGNIPSDGGCIVVANHPHGMLDGVGMIKVLLEHRKDVRVMANHLLYCFEELETTFIGVDPFGGDNAKRFNTKAVLEARKWIKDGGLLVIFPGGEVSSLDWRKRNITDPAWDSGVSWLAEKSNVPVVPVFIDGRNSMWFQIAGLLHPRLRTCLLVQEFLHHKGKVINIFCGPLINSKTLLRLPDASEIARYLRTCTYLINDRNSYRKPFSLGRKPVPRTPEKIGSGYSAQVLNSEVQSLPQEQCLVSNSGKLEVWYAHAEQIPTVLKEIGRLREVTFRDVGEGTGKTEDLDEFDTYYQHLFLWHTESKQIIGGYRLGDAKTILELKGRQGLYICSLFTLAEELHQDLNSALEVGRSFVRIEHQRNYSSLMLLWKGIGRYVALNPNFRYLLGPVSISNDYHPLSQQLIVRFLQGNSMEKERASLVTPKRPFRLEEKHSKRVDISIADLEVVGNLLATLEDDNVGIPVLLRQYLKLNGRILGFNVDHEFGNSIDCLLWVDLTKTDEILLKKYMDPQNAITFLSRHTNT